MRREFSRDETAQMLLMTGLILMFALLTMSLNTVKTASLGEPYDAHKDAVLDASAETLVVWQPLLENRSAALYDAGSNETESAAAAAQSPTCRSSRSSSGSDLLWKPKGRPCTK